MSINISIYITIYLGETPAQGGNPTPKNRDFLNVKLQIFGTHGDENFQKIGGFKEKLAIFWSLYKNSAKYSSIEWFWTILGTKIIVS